MKIRILTEHKQIFAGEAREVVMPGEDGELAVWNFHEPCISRLRSGQIKVRLGDAGAQEAPQVFPIRGGIARIGPLEIVVLVESLQVKVA